MDSNPQNSADQIEKVCIVGSGNWGSAIATLVGRNCRRLSNCDDEVKMWVYEEMVEDEDGVEKKLTDIINNRHENIKYLPGINLPSNVVAVPDLKEAATNATLLIFVLPHQFLPKLLPTIREAAHPSCRGVSLIKGLGKKPISSPHGQLSHVEVSWGREKKNFSPPARRHVLIPTQKHWNTFECDGAMTEKR